jgi:uncharacterized membrane protein YeaQ/YmgE (transglycosylase-associated protein family)
MSNDVFISCKNRDKRGVKTRDAEIADEVYDFLTGKGLSVFLSTPTLEQLGASDYTREIDSALESATVLLAIGTSADHLDSKWVRYEWDSFANDIRSGIKPNGKIFTYIERMPITALPRGLRQTQTFEHSRSSLERLYNFIYKALHPSAEKRVREEKAWPEAERAERERNQRLEVEPRLPPPSPSFPFLHIFWYIVLGFLAGATAKFIMHMHLNLITTTLLGIVGSIVGGLIARLFSKPTGGGWFHPAGLILSIIGALIVLFIVGKFT